MLRSSPLNFSPLSLTVINGIYSIRMPIASTTINKANIEKSWELIKSISNDIIK